MSDEHEQLLVSRVIEPDATAKAWNELTAAAEADPSLWRQTVQTLRDHHAFARAVNASTAIADGVPATQAPQPRQRAEVEIAPRGRPQLLRWSGWAVAALVVLAWASGLAGPGRSFPAGLPGQHVSAAEHFDRYLEQGRQEGLVFDEVPEKILIHTRPAPAGDGVELYYLRQILERTTVPDLYRFAGEDELGRPALIRFRPHSGPPM